MNQEGRISMQGHVRTTLGYRSMRRGLLLRNTVSTHDLDTFQLFWPNENEQLQGQINYSFGGEIRSLPSVQSANLFHNCTLHFIGIREGESGERGVGKLNIEHRSP